MPQVIYADATDEITDLVERIRTSSDESVALVLHPGTTGFQTPLNVRLLQQLGTRAGKTVSVISGDPRIQELSRVGGLPTYASVPAFERGIQTIRPHHDEAAVAPAVAMPLGPPPPPPNAATPASARRGPGTGGPAAAGHRRPAVFVVIGLVVLGLLLLFVVAPSAKVTITLAGTPLTANPTIQGSTDPANAGQADHIVTTLVTSTQSTQFNATPTGKQQVPATAATATVQFSNTVPPGGVEFDLAQGTRIQTSDGSITFVVTQTTHICMGYNGAPPPACQQGSGNDTAPVQDSTPEAKGNVPADTITQWTHADGNPCDPNTPSQNQGECNGGSIMVKNPQPATGGADAKTNVVASSSDVTAWNTQVTQAEQTLTAQANQDMASKASGKTIAKDPGGNGSSVSCAVTPQLPAANAVFAPTQETVACNGKATAYNPADVNAVVRADLQSQVAQGDSLATDAITCSKPAVTQAADDGTVVLSVQCSSFSRPAVDLAALKGQLTGRSPGDVKNIIEHRLDHVTDVVVSQSPVPFFWLPLFSSRIEIDEAFVNQSAH